MQKSPGISPDHLEALLEGTTYRPLGSLGKGGMGEVFRVTDQFLGCEFALKVLFPHLVAKIPNLADRARVEAQATARLNDLHHPHVVEVVHFWVASDGTPCTLMELLQGRTLAERLLQGPDIPMREGLNFACQAASALAAAHGLGIVHRDIKPENLFLHELPAGASPILKVLDFGLARVLPGLSPLRPLAKRTSTGAWVGSGRYMAPEVSEGQRADHRADLYSLGIVLYVMLVGHGPMNAEPPSCHAQVGPELDAIVERAIQENPNQRYQSAEAFLGDLRTALRGVP